MHHLNSSCSRRWHASRNQPANPTQDQYRILNTRRAVRLTFQTHLTLLLLLQSHIAGYTLITLPPPPPESRLPHFVNKRRPLLAIHFISPIHQLLPLPRPSLFRENYTFVQENIVTTAAACMVRAFHSTSLHSPPSSYRTQRKPQHAPTPSPLFPARLLHSQPLSLD